MNGEGDFSRGTEADGNRLTLKYYRCGMIPVGEYVSAILIILQSPCPARFFGERKPPAVVHCSALWPVAVIAQVFR